MGTDHPYSVRVWQSSRRVCSLCGGRSALVHPTPRQLSLRRACESSGILSSRRVLNPSCGLLAVTAQTSLYLSDFSLGQFEDLTSASGGNLVRTAPLSGLLSRIWAPQVRLPLQPQTSVLCPHSPTEGQSPFFVFNLFAFLCLDLQPLTCSKDWHIYPRLGDLKMHQLTILNFLNFLFYTR